MLRAQLEFHWRTYLFPVANMAVLVAFTFGVLAMVSYGERAVGTSARLSVPAADFTVYVEHSPAVEVAKELETNPHVAAVHVDAWHPAEAIAPDANAAFVVRALPPHEFRTQDLVHGAFPTQVGEIALTHQLAQALGVTTDSPLTIAGDGVAKRMTVVGIYARSPFEDQLDSAYEGLTLGVHPSYVAAQVDDSGKGGIDVRGTSAASANHVMDELLDTGMSVVIRPAERYGLVAERHARAFDMATTVVPWLLAVGFLTATTLMTLGLIGAHQHRLTERRTLQGLGVRRRVYTGMYVRELAIVTAVGGVCGLALGVGGAQAFVALLQTTPGAAFLPHTLQAPLWTYIAALGALVVSVVVAGLLVTLTSGRTPLRRQRTVALIPLSAGTGALAVYGAGLLPLNLPAEPPVAVLARDMTVIAVVVSVAFAVALGLIAAVTRLAHLAARTHLSPRSRLGLVRIVALLVVFLSAATLTTIHTVAASLGGDDTTLSERFDMSVRARLGEDHLTSEQLTAIRTWEHTDRSLALRVVDTDLPADGAFQPGIVYAVDPGEASTYLRAPVDMAGRLLVPRGTPALPDQVSFSYVDDAGITHDLDLDISEANVPVALVSTDQVIGLNVDEAWVRLKSESKPQLPQAYPEFEEAIGAHAPDSPPLITLSINDGGARALRGSEIVMVLQASTCAILGFMAFMWIPRAFDRYAEEDRYLRSLGISARRRLARRFTDAGLSSAIMFGVGGVVGAGTAWLVLHNYGGIYAPMHVPVVEIGWNFVAIMALSAGFGALLSYEMMKSSRLTTYNW